MKKSVAALCTVLMVCLLLSSAASVKSEDYDTLTDWNVRIDVPEGATAVLQGNEYYIYAQQEGSIPYVMLTIYQSGDAEGLLGEFTEYMQEQYPDLQVTSGITEKAFGDKTCFETDYSYEVGGYEVKDRRVVTIAGETAYMFASKEIESLDMTTGTMLDDIVADSEFLSGGDSGQNTDLSDGYLYCQENGMPGFWLDFTGAVDDNLVLHCWFPSGGRTFSENCFVLDMSSAEITQDGMKIHQIRDLDGAVCSDCFRDLTLQFYLDGAVMIVERGEKALTEEAEDTLRTGTYVMSPVGVAADAGQKESRLCPADDGPYQPEELCMWAQFCYLRETGMFLTGTEAAENPDGTFTIRLYEDPDADGSADTGGSVQYTVDAYGVGKNDVTGEPVSLM